MRLFLPFIAVLVQSVSGAIYYVDATGGSDSNDGLTTGAAWQTLGKATNATYSAGDSILLKRGETWNETFYFTTTETTLGAYGTGADPIIDGLDAQRYGIFVKSGVSNTVTRNIHVKNIGHGETGHSWGIYTGTNTIEFCFLENSTFDSHVAAKGDSHMIVSNCWLTGAKDEAITLHDTASAYVINCTVTNNDTGINNSGTDMQLTVIGCTFADNGDDAGGFGDIDALSATVATFSRCTFRGRDDAVAWAFLKSCTNTITFDYCVFNASRATGIGSLGISGNHTFLNCTFYGKKNESISVAADKVFAATNCIFATWNGDVYYFSGGTWNAGYCLFYDVAGLDITANGNSLGTSDPQFVSAATGDFSIPVGSPCVNAGVDVGLTSDILGNALSGLPDVGAYEYQPPVTVPTRAVLRGTFNFGGKWSSN